MAWLAPTAPVTSLSKPMKVVFGAKAVPAPSGGSGGSGGGSQPVYPYAG